MVPFHLLNVLKIKVCYLIVSIPDLCTLTLFYFDSLRPSQQFFSHVGTDLAGLNQSCSMAQLSASSEPNTHNPLISNQARYNLASNTLHRAVDFEGKVWNVVGRRKENENNFNKIEPQD